MQEILSVDFDGTLVTNEYPNIGMGIYYVLDYVKAEKERGVVLILNTCRRGNYLKEAVDWCKGMGLEFDYVNENTPEMIKLFGGDTRKIFAHRYLDDRNIKLEDIA